MRSTPKYSYAQVVAIPRVIGREIEILCCLIALLVASSDLSWAQSRSSIIQTVTVEVKPITKIAMAGNPNPLIIADDAPGSERSIVRDNNTKYSLITNMENMKIIASLNDNMPAGTRLMVELSSDKATSLGRVDLSDAVVPVDVVTGLSKTSDLNQSISYTFAADPDVREIATQTRTVTFTLTN